MSDTQADAKSAWAQLLEQVWTGHLQSAWQVGDLVNSGIGQFTDGSKDQVADLLGEIAEQLEVSPKTLENYGRLSARFQEGNRFGPPISMAHHDVVAALSDEEAYQWLHQAWQNGWSVSRLRLELRVRSDVEQPVELPEPVAVERAFYRSGVKAKLTRKRCTFELNGSTLVLTSEADIHWGLLD